MARQYQKLPLITMPGEPPAFGIFAREIGQPHIAEVGYRNLLNLTSETIADDVVAKLTEDDSQWKDILAAASS